MKRYTSADEISAAFIKKGWSSNTRLTELIEPKDAHGCIGIIEKMKKGQKFFVMNVTGNIFDDKGKLVLFNLNTVNKKET